MWEEITNTFLNFNGEDHTYSTVLSMYFLLHAEIKVNPF